MSRKHRLEAVARKVRAPIVHGIVESRPLPMTKRLTAGLKPGECAVVGWQNSQPVEPAWLTQLLAKNAAKSVKRTRYERMMSRRQSHNGGASR